MILQRYILRQVLLAFATAVGGITFVVFPAVAVSAVHRLGGVQVSALLDYLPLVGMDLLPYLAPMGFLLAVVAVYGRLAADREWTAICMARRNPLTMLMPALGVALVLGLLTHHLLSVVRPEWKYEQKIYARSMLIETFKDLNPGRTELSFEDFYLNAARRPTPDSFAEVLVYIPGKDDQEDLKIVADLATFRFVSAARPDGAAPQPGEAERVDELLVRFENARIVKGPNDLTAESPEVRIPLDEIFEDPRGTHDRGKYYTSAELARILAAPELPSGIDPTKRAGFEYEIQSRRALSVSYFLFVLIGVPIGLRLRKGTQLAAMTAAVGVAFVYYVASIRLGNQLTELGRLPAWLAVWSTNAVAFVVGLLATWRIVRR